jgi:hypothetical protein
MKKIVCVVAMLFLVHCQNDSETRYSLLQKNDWSITGMVIDNKKMDSNSISLIRKYSIFKLSFGNKTCLEKNREDEKYNNKIRNVKTGKADRKRLDSSYQDGCDEFLNQFKNGNDEPFYCCTYKEYCKTIGCFYRITGMRLELLKCGLMDLDLCIVTGANKDDLKHLYQLSSAIAFSCRSFSVSRESLAMYDSLGNYLVFNPIKKGKKP